MENSHEEDMDFDDGFSSEDDHEVEDLINEIFGSEEADVDLEPEEDSSEVNSMWNATRCLMGEIFSGSKVHQSCRRINTTIL